MAELRSDARAGQRRGEGTHGDDAVHEGLGVNQDRPPDTAVAVSAVRRLHKVCGGKLDSRRVLQACALHNHLIAPVHAHGLPEPPERGHFGRRK